MPKKVVEVEEEFDKVYTFLGHEVGDVYYNLYKENFVSGWEQAEKDLQT